MASFKDKLGREWVFDLTVADLKAVRQATGVEFTAGGGSSLYDQIAKLAGDFDLMGKAVWSLVKDQAAERAVDYESWERGLNRDAIRASALALIDAFVDFYHPPAAAAEMKGAVRGVMATAETLIATELGAAMKSLTDRPFPSNGFAGSTPASPASIPAA